ASVKHLAGEKIVDDDYVTTGGQVLGRKIASCEQRDAHHLQISRTHEVISCGGQRGGVHLTVDPKTPHGVVAAHWQQRSHGYAGYAGETFEVLPRLLVER